MPRATLSTGISIFACFALLTPLAALAASSGTPPRSWVDKDTGHRIIRLSNEPDSQSLYFNVNAYSPDGKLMVYTAPDGIHVLDFATLKTRLLVANPPLPPGSEKDRFARFGYGVRLIQAGFRTPSVFYTQFDPATRASALYKADMYTGKVTKLAELERGESIDTINADETLGAGAMVEPSGQQNARMRFSRGQRSNLPHWQAKEEMMEHRLHSHLPMILYTVDLHPGPDQGKMKVILHTTDWIDHFLFSPTDPTLLLYSHEGPWHEVDRSWIIRTDGTENMPIHKRTMAMEIWGHEFWGLDGKTIWYDWQYPESEVFFVAGYNVETHRKVAYHLTRDDWSIHFNVNQGATLFCGDGGDPGQVAHAKNGEWIELFHPEMIPLDGALNAPDFWQPGVFHAEHLVNMAHHDYRLEPNVRFSPNGKMVIFRSNMFGPSYVFGVEVAKAVDAKPAEIQSTPKLAAQFNPVNPTPVDMLPPIESTPPSH